MNEIIVFLPLSLPPGYLNIAINRHHQTGIYQFDGVSLFLNRLNATHDKAPAKFSAGANL
jgi:hypothetical protein